MILNMSLSPRLTDIGYLQSFLKNHDIDPQHSAGQNFLVCEEVVEATITLLKGAPRLVTELGAGLGALTGPLLEVGFTVRAIERDEVLATLLKKNVSRALSDKLDLQMADLKTVGWEQDEDYCLVGNIPYNLSGLIIRQITSLTPAPRRVVLLVQNEVAMRIVSDAPDMQLMALAVGLWGSARNALHVPADCFWPIPKVTSQLVVFEPRENLILEHEEREKVLKTARGFFQAKRKQVGGVLRRRLGISADEAASLLGQVGIDSTWRPQHISVERWVELHKILAEYESK